MTDEMIALCVAAGATGLLAALLMLLNYNVRYGWAKTLSFGAMLLAFVVCAACVVKLVAIAW